MRVGVTLRHVRESGGDRWNRCPSVYDLGCCRVSRSVIAETRVGERETAKKLDSTACSRLLRHERRTGGVDEVGDSKGCEGRRDLNPCVFLRAQSVFWVASAFAQLVEE